MVRNRCPVETIRWTPEIKNRPLEMNHRPVEIKHRPQETKHRPMESKHRPVETILRTLFLFRCAIFSKL